MTNPTETRGYLNNNPGNIDRSPNFRWNEEIRDPKDPRLTQFQKKELTKGRFCVFPHAGYGIRALVLNLQAYQRSGLLSIRAMINRWAPPVENNTEAYIAAVAQTLKVSADVPVDMADYKTAFAMADAIIKVECAGQPYTPTELEDGLRLAGIVKPVTLGSSRTIQAAATATTGVGIGGAATQVQGVADTIAPAAATSTWLTTLVIVLKLLAVVLTLAGIGWMVYQRFGRARRDAEIEQVPDNAVPAEPMPAGASR